MAAFDRLKQNQVVIITALPADLNWPVQNVFVQIVKYICISAKTDNNNLLCTTCGMTDEYKCLANVLVVLLWLIVVGNMTNIVGNN